MKCSRYSLLSFMLVLLFFSQCSPVSGAENFNVTGSMTHVMTLQPGGKANGKIEIENTGDEPGEVKIYLVDYLHYSDGTNNFEKAGSMGRSNAPWVSLSPSQSLIQPKGKLTVNYSVGVPADPNLRGTYWSVIMIEPVPKALLTPPSSRAEVRRQVITVIRHAVQMITNIGNGGEAKIAFKDRQLVKEEGKRILKIDLENTGEKLLSPHVWAELFDAGGKTTGQIDGSTTRIYPGCSARFQMDMTAIPAGSYKAVVVADNGDENVFGANYTLDLK